MTRISPLELGGL